MAGRARAGRAPRSGAPPGRPRGAGRAAPPAPARARTNGREVSDRTALAESAICCGVRYAAPIEPSAPASETAATSRGVSPPPAIGAWTIGCWIRSRVNRSVALPMRNPPGSGGLGGGAASGSSRGGGSPSPGRGGGEALHAFGDQVRRPVGEVQPQEVALGRAREERRSGYEGNPLAQRLGQEAR